MREYPTVQEGLSKRWKVVLNTQNDDNEDDSIFTEDDKEVVGSSEWIRVDPVILQHIVDIHNASL
jgi:hypothetical protein